MLRKRWSWTCWRWRKKGSTRRRNVECFNVRSVDNHNIKFAFFLYINMGSQLERPYDSTVNITQFCGLNSLNIGTRLQLDLFFLKSKIIEIGSTEAQESALRLIPLYQNSFIDSLVTQSYLINHISF